ncbi:MAG TPA: YidC/Oxa1 family membrane protein insertase [Candidatus Limnocylindria bacterium]|nr:YidC/Oxa1 family membrane protein insertase [Candidatus Limnocylindria bacterium]
MPPTVAAGFLGIEHFTPPWDVFYLPLFNILIAAYQLLFNDFALAIIVFTVIIRTALAPLFVKQIRSQREMQRMQPLIREVQRKHKGNRQKVSEETMALYREHGVNPAAGCLPVILQLPILFALYQAIIRASNVVTVNAQQAASDTFAQVEAALPGIERLREQGENILYAAPVQGTGEACSLPQFSEAPWSHFLPLNCQLIEPVKLNGAVDTTVGWLFNLDLAQVDNVFALQLGGPEGFAISGLAILAAVLQFVQVKMTSPRPNPDDPTAATSTTMVYLFPLMTIIWGGLFPSGLILYWAIYTGYLVVHQFLMMGWGNLFPIFGWQPKWAPAPDGAAAPPVRRREPEREGKQEASATDAAPNSRPSTNTRSGGAPGGSRQQRAGRKRRGRKR